MIVQDLLPETCDKFEFVKLKKIINNGKDLKLKVRTDSMSPLIKINDVIEVTSIKDGEESIKIFDIVVYWDGKRLFCHYIWHQNRLMKKDGKNTFVPKTLLGESNDKPVNFNEILGRVKGKRINKITRFKIMLKHIFKF